MSEISVTESQIFAVAATALIRDGFQQWPDIFPSLSESMREINRALDVVDLVDQVDSIRDFENWAIEGALDRYAETYPQIRKHLENSPAWHLNILLPGFCAHKIAAVNRESDNRDFELETNAGVVISITNAVIEHMKQTGVM
mgnify:CR=1 FL=1